MSIREDDPEVIGRHVRPTRAKKRKPKDPVKFVKRVERKVAKQQAPQSWRQWLWHDVLGHSKGTPRSRAHVRGSYRPRLRHMVAPLRRALHEAAGAEPVRGPVSRLPDGAAPGHWGQWLCIDCEDTTDNRPCDHCGGERCVLGLVCSSCGLEDTIAPDLLGARCSTCKRGTWVPDETATVPR